MKKAVKGPIPEPTKKLIVEFIVAFRIKLRQKTSKMVPPESTTKLFIPAKV
jgi:hypothetical protein